MAVISVNAARERPAGRVVPSVLVAAVLNKREVFLAVSFVERGSLGDPGLVALYVSYRGQRHDVVAIVPRCQEGEGRVQMWIVGFPPHVMIGGKRYGTVHLFSPE